LHAILAQDAIPRFGDVEDKAGCARTLIRNTLSSSIASCHATSNGRIVPPSVALWLASGRDLIAPRGRQHAWWIYPNVIPRQEGAMNRAPTDRLCPNPGSVRPRY